VDHIDMQSDAKHKEGGWRTMQRPSASRIRFAPPPRWLAAFGHPDAQLPDAVRSAIAAMPVDQRGEFIVEGPDWIELHGLDGHRAKGGSVLADRGDRLQVHFEDWMLMAEIDAQGQLVLLGAADEVIARHEPLRKAIVTGYQGPYHAISARDRRSC